jgi:hypothetical protein
MDPTKFVEVFRGFFPFSGWVMFMLYSVQHLCNWCETFNLIVYTQDWLAVRKIVTDLLSKIEVHDPGFPIGNCADFMLVVTVVLVVYRLTLRVKAEKTIIRLFIHTKGIAAAHRRMDEHEEFQSKKPASLATTARLESTRQPQVSTPVATTARLESTRKPQVSTPLATTAKLESTRLRRVSTPFATTARLESTRQIQVST